MKKFLSILIVYFVYSVSVFAQNYTIQSVHSYNQNYVPKNYTTGEQVINSAFDAFCQGSRNFLLQSSSQSVNSIQHFVFDPYLIEIDGIRYMLVKDNNDGKFETESISTAFVAYFPSDKPEYSISITTPNISYINNRSGYIYPFNKTVIRKITDNL